jgi:hypothetical protein
MNKTISTKLLGRSPRVERMVPTWARPPKKTAKAKKSKKK